MRYNLIQNTWLEASAHHVWQGVNEDQDAEKSESSRRARKGFREIGYGVDREAR